MKNFLKRLLGHEIFRSMVSWPTNFFFWKICNILRPPPTLLHTYLYAPLNRKRNTWISHLNVYLQKKYLTLKKLTKQKLQKSISLKNKLVAKVIKLKEPTLNNEFPTKYRIYRNMLATLMKRGKQTYFSSFFENHINYFKNTWKGIKE